MKGYRVTRIDVRGKRPPRDYGRDEVGVYNAPRASLEERYPAEIHVRPTGGRCRYEIDVVEVSGVVSTGPSWAEEESIASQ